MFFLQLQPPPTSTLFPYTTLFRSGGADTAGSGGKFTREFLEHCLRGTNSATGKIGTPLDFISFHAKGAPIYTDRKSTRLNSSHRCISYAVFCLKKKKKS